MSWTGSARLATGSSGSTAACSAPCGAPPPQLTLLFVPAAYTGAGGVPWIGLVLLVLRDPQEELGKVTWRYLRASRRVPATATSSRKVAERERRGHPGIISLNQPIPALHVFPGYVPGYAERLASTSTS